MKTSTKPQIESYSFGSMVIDGREYTADLILHEDGRIQDDWWREQGHLLGPDDIMDVLTAAPSRLIIGTGASGIMALSDELLRECRNRGIRVDSAPTAEAVILYNRALEEEDSVAACFHLTC